jgi:hypothetical protein
MGTPFKIQKSYMTELEPDELKSIIQKKISEKGFLSFVSNYRGFYRGDKILLLSQTPKKGNWTTIRGKVTIVNSKLQIDLIFRPTFSPLYIFIPVLTLLTCSLIIAKTRVVNGETVSFGVSAAFTFLVYLIIVALFSWITINALREECEKLEQELFLSRVSH